MQLVIKTNKGIEFDVEGRGIVDLQKDLNNRQLLAITISGIVMNKGNVKTVLTKERPEPGLDTYILTTMDGYSYRTQITEYKPTEISTTLNDVQSDFVLIGDILIHRHNFDFLQKELEG